jgi:hypothetical protein
MKWSYANPIIESNKNVIIPNNEDDIKDSPKKVGFYQDFFLSNNKDKYNNSIDLRKFGIECNNVNEMLILNYWSNKTKSRFSRLFEEIRENDKKLSEEKNYGNKDSETDIDSNNNIIINPNFRGKLNNNIIKNDNYINDNVINNYNIDSNNINNGNGNNSVISINNKVQNFNNSDLVENMNMFDSDKIFNPFLSENRAPLFFSNKNAFINSPNEINSNNNSIQNGFKNNEYINNYSDQSEQKSKTMYNHSPSSPYSISKNEADYNYKSNNYASFENHQDRNIIVDIKKIICLEDRRTTVMIKNIPNKFNKDLILSIIDQNFKGAYDLFILPTDINRYKNFGYSFINFTNSYYIPYFYYLFNGKRWSSTNSQKICEITYSKVQGRNNLLFHYANKIVFRNDDAKRNNIEQKYIIPNEYKIIFTRAFPNYIVDDYKYYFICKIPLV